MPAYLFEIAPFLAGRSVTVRDAVSGSDVASGTLDANAKFTVSLPVGDYVASASDGRYTYRASGVVDQGDPDRLADSALSSTYGTLDQILSPRLRVPEKPAETVVSTFQSGHGWAADGTGTANVNDTGTYLFGTQSAAMTTNGAGATQRVSRMGMPVVDTTGKLIQISVRIDNLANLKTLTFYAGSGSLANNYNWTPFSNSLGTTSDVGYWIEGEWANFTLPWESAAITGTPSRSNITDMRLAAIDNNTGQQVTVRLNKVALLPQPATFPNGVVTFMFDDGYLDAYTQGRRKLSQYGFRATELPIVDLVGNVGGSYLSLAQLKELQNIHGWEIAPHANTAAAHNAGFNSLADGGAAEMRANKKWLMENGLTSGLDLFAYPRGLYNSTTLAAVQRYFSAARGTYVRTRETFPFADRFKLRTRGLGLGTTLAQVQADVDAIKANKGWLIFTIHKLGATAADGSTWAISDFDTVVDYIATQGVAVRTFGQVISTSAS